MPEDNDETYLKAYRRECELISQSNSLSRIKAQVSHEHVSVLFALALLEESTRWEASDNQMSCLTHGSYWHNMAALDQ